MKTIITETNVVELINNGNLYLENIDGIEKPVGGEDHDVLTFAKSYTDRLATYADIPEILRSPVKMVYIREQKHAAPTFTEQRVLA